MDSIMSGAAQPLGDIRGQCVVDQEFQAVFISGSSRSRTASAA
jgi:hypothetical protein